MPCSKFKAGLLTEESVRDHTCDARTGFGCQRPELKHNFSEASFSIEVPSAEELSNDKADRLSRGANPLDEGGLFFLDLNPILCVLRSWVRFPSCAVCIYFIIFIEKLLRGNAPRGPPHSSNRQGPSQRRRSRYVALVCASRESHHSFHRLAAALLLLSLFTFHFFPPRLPS